MDDDNAATADSSTSPAKLAAAQFADSTWRDCGAAYFNPLIGEDAEETFANIGDVLGFLHSALDPHNEVEECRHGLMLILQTTWAAAQYSGHLLGAMKKAAP